MKHMTVVLSAAVLLLVGCVYESPLTEKDSIAVDSKVLGLWELAPDEGEESAEDERLMILKYSDTEYLIHYPPGGNDEAYYRGYPIMIGGVSCVQLQVIGFANGTLKKGAKDLFHVFSYELIDGQLEIKMINMGLVDNDLKTANELRKAFLQHKDKDTLFIEPGRFRRVKQ